MRRRVTAALVGLVVSVGVRPAAANLPNPIGVYTRIGEFDEHLSLQWSSSGNDHVVMLDWGLVLMAEFPPSSTPLDEVRTWSIACPYDGTSCTETDVEVTDLAGSADQARIEFTLSGDTYLVECDAQPETPNLTHSWSKPAAHGSETWETDDDDPDSMLDYLDISSEVEEPCKILHGERALNADVIVARHAKGAAAINF